MPLPIVLALIVCDDVWIDANSGKQTVLGIYGSVATRQFPYVMPRLAIYISLTECPPEMPIRVSVVDVDDQYPPIVDGEQVIQSSDPREVAQGTVRARNVAFPAAGEYRVQLWACGELMVERRLLLIKMSEVSDG